MPHDTQERVIDVPAHVKRIPEQLCDELRDLCRQMAGYNITRETMVRLMDEGIAEYERIEEPEREAEDGE